MVSIRLARHGAKKAPFYRVVVADQRARRDGAFIEQVGTYDPSAKGEKISLDIEKINEWKAKGAQPTDRVVKLIAAYTGEPLPEKFQQRIAHTPAKAKKEK